MAISKKKQDEITKEWIQNPVDRFASKECGCWFDLDAANHVCDFFTRYLRLSKGKWAAKSFELMDWQRYKLLMPLFGWKNPDGFRRFRVAYVEIPKKNGKSGICSGLSLYLGLVDGEPGAEVYCAAADRKQAGIVFNESSNMVESSRDLSRYAKVTKSEKKIEFPGTKSIIQVISSEAYTAEGLNIHGLIFDELHAQPKRELWDALRYGGAARDQPLLISITTAGWDTTSICYEQHEYALKVLKGDIDDPSFFPLVYAADKQDDISKPETWRKANPSLGITIKEEDMKAAALEASESPVKMNAFKRYRLNIWTEAADRWLNGEDWAKCTTVENAQVWRKAALGRLRGVPCYGGLDLGATSDISAFVAYFPEASHTVLPWFWVPESALQDDKNPNRDLYRTWIEQGFLIKTAGNIADYDKIRADINDIAKMIDLKEIAVDKNFQGLQLCTQLMDDEFEVIAFGQGFSSFAAPCKSFEEMVKGAKFETGNNPILKWMAANVVAEEDKYGNMRPIKPGKKSPHKIDGIVSLIMARGRAMLQEDNTSVYEERGMIVL